MPHMADWLSAFRYAARGLRRQPTFLLVSLVTLALGIGATTAIFSVIKAVVLNPLPYDAPEQIAVLWEVSPEGNQERVAVPTYEDWKRETTRFQSVAAYRQVDFSYAGTGDPRNVPGVRATPDLFTVLRAQAIVGRTFTPDESIVGADRVVVVSHGFWTRELGASAAAIGRAIQLDAVPFTVVGVMPAAFEFPTSTHVEVWTPLAFDPKDLHGASRRARSLTLVGRLADGATMAQAQDELSVLSARIAAAHADSNAGWGARVVAAHEQLVAQSRSALMVLMGAVAFLLLIVCANMANLLLARASSRRREGLPYVERSAPDAGKWRGRSWPKACCWPLAAACSGSPRPSAVCVSSPPCPTASCRAWTRSSSMAACCSSRWPSRSAWPSPSVCCRPCAPPVTCATRCTSRRGQRAAPTPGGC